MILSPDYDARCRLYRNLARECAVSQNERRARVSAQRTAYLTGTDSGGRALYNRLREWADSSAANLYAPGMARWAVASPAHYGDKFREEEAAARDYFARYWDASGASLVFDLGVEWAHPFDSVVFKVVANDNAPRLWMLPDPSDLGVLREDLPTLDQQEAICHYYDLDLSAFERLIAVLPTERRQAMRQAAADHASPPRSSASLIPAPVQNIILTAASPSSLSGAVLGIPHILLGLAKVQEPCARMAELWVRDDRARSWMRVLVHVPTDEILHEEPMESTYGAAHAFHSLTLSEVPGYLWGLSPMDGLTALQRWREKRMAQIDLREDLQMDPPLMFAGVLGLTDEQAIRVRAPGGNVYSQLPNASVTPILAPMPPDAMALVDAIDRMFDRQSGMTHGGAGEGQPNVRSGDQEFALAALGSPRTRRKAARVEAVANRIATQMLRITARVEGTTFLKRDGSEFFPSQLPPDITAEISAHSASPYYEAAIKADAAIALQVGAIDKEDFIEMTSLPLQHALRAKARRRMQLEAEVAKGQLGREDALVKAKAITAESHLIKAEKP